MLGNALRILCQQRTLIVSEIDSRVRVSFMSEQAIEFLEEWISEKVQRQQPVLVPAPLEKQAEILCLKCQADAAKAGVPLDEIVEEVGDLEDLIAAKLEDAEQASAKPGASGESQALGNVVRLPRVTAPDGVR
jgi:hypothetical protein